MAPLTTLDWGLATTISAYHASVFPLVEGAVSQRRSTPAAEPRIWGVGPVSDDEL